MALRKKKKASAHHFQKRQIASSADVLGWSEVVKINNIMRRPESGGTHLGSFFRDLANVHLAMHDAYNIIQWKYEPFYVAFTATSQTARSAAPDLAALTAGYRLLLPLIDNAISSASPEEKSSYESLKKNLEDLYVESVAKISDGEARKNSVAIGEEVAKLYQIVRNESFTPIPYKVSTERGQFRFEEGDVGDDEDWAGTKPYGICNLEAASGGVRQKPFSPTDLKKATYLRDYEYTRCIGRKDDENGIPTKGPGCKVVASEEDLKFFYAMDISGHTVANQIVKRVVEHLNSSFPEALRLFAGANLAMADATISSWKTRQRVNHWRPFTAIRNGLSDKSLPGATQEPDWISRSQDVPNFPEFFSGNVTIMGAPIAWIAKALSENSKSKGNGYDVSNLNGKPLTFRFEGVYKKNGVEIPVAQEFTDLKKMNEANARSRVLSGDHFPESTKVALAFADRMGRKTYELKFLRPYSKDSVLQVDAQGLIKRCQ